QEIQYGQGALHNIGEQPNIRQAFDGAVLRLTTLGQPQGGLLARRPIHYDRHNYQDSSNNHTRLLGLYANRSPARQPGLDLYAFARDMDERNFQGFVGREERYTLGTRLFGRQQQLDWNWDLMLQGGEHAGRDIRAWAIRS